MRRRRQWVPGFVVLALLLSIPARVAAERADRDGADRSGRETHRPVRPPALDLGTSYDPAYDPNTGVVGECTEPGDDPVDLETLLGRAVALPEPVYCPDESCPGTCSTAIPISVPGSVDLRIDPPIVIPGTPPIRDVEWVAFDIPLTEPGNPHDPLVGQLVRIETTGSCATEAECSTPAFDTALGLYGYCDPLGRVSPLATDGDGGLGWLSAIDGRGYCVVDGRAPCTGPGCPAPERCLTDADCRRAEGGPQSHAFCAAATCLAAGTYYVMASGEFGASPPSFDLRVTKIGTCPVARADAYESDDVGWDATTIGWPSSLPGNGNGRANREIQTHTIVTNEALTSDVDFVRVETAHDAKIRVTTAVTQPRPSNGYFYRPLSWESNTQIMAQYADGVRGQAGVCNHNSSFRGGSFVDLGCYSSATNFGIRGLGPDEDPNGCLAGLPPRFFEVPSNWCVPNYMVPFLSSNFPSHDPPLVVHDDNDPSRGDLGSTIELCLPAEGQSTDPGNPIVFGVTDSSNNWTAIAGYPYEVRAQTLSSCTFEREPNQSPFEASPIAVDQEVFGLNDTAITRRTSVITPVRRCSTFPGLRCYATPRPAGPNRFLTILDQCPSGGTCTGDPLEAAVTVGGFHDFDWWGPFDVDVWTPIEFRLEPQILDPQGDTSLRLYVGPVDVDGDGPDDFPLLVGDSASTTPGSTIALLLPPAERYGGPGAGYYLVAGIRQIGGDAGSSIADHYYKLSISKTLPLAESEPNDDCRSTSHAAKIGETWRGALSPSGGVDLAEWGFAQDGDIDAYRVEVLENTRISFSTDGDPATTDTALQIESCGSGTILACDEDGQYPQNGTYGSLLRGCLPPGEYCVRVRAWAGLGPEFGMNEHYTLRFTGTPGCDPLTDPVLGDGAGSCQEPFDAALDGDRDGTPGRTACGLPLE